MSTTSIHFFGLVPGGPGFPGERGPAVRAWSRECEPEPRPEPGVTVIDLTDDLTAALASPKVQQELRRTVTDVLRAELRMLPLGGDRLVDAEEAAEILGMTTAAVRKAAMRRTIPAERVGRRLRFRLSSLLARDRGG
jgi:excisionase family DNA binding protein